MSTKRYLIRRRIACMLIAGALPSLCLLGIEIASAGDRFIRPIKLPSSIQLVDWAWDGNTLVSCEPAKGRRVVTVLDLGVDPVQPRQLRADSLGSFPSVLPGRKLV